MANGGKRPGAGRKLGFAAKAAEASRKYIAGIIKKEQKDIIAKAVEQAKDGDAKARDFLYERGFGRVPQVVAGDNDGGPITHSVEVTFRD